MKKLKSGYCIFCNNQAIEGDDVHWSITKYKKLIIWHDDCLDIYSKLGHIPEGITNDRNHN